MKTRGKEKARVELILLAVALIACALLIGYAVKKSAPKTSSSSKPKKTVSYDAGDTASDRAKETASLQDKLFREPTNFVSSVPIIDGKLDINEATAEDLMTVEGIGEKLAAEIIRYRQVHGPFRTMQDLADIAGIGTKKLDALREKFCVQP